MVMFPSLNVEKTLELVLFEPYIKNDSYLQYCLIIKIGHGHTISYICCKT